MGPPCATAPFNSSTAAQMTSADPTDLSGPSAESACLPRHRGHCPNWSRPELVAELLVRRAKGIASL